MSAATPDRDSDPLLRAVAQGDEHCPDGVALARLGRLLRHEQPRAADVSSRVAERLARDEADCAVTTPDDALRIDRHFEDGEADPELAHLGRLMTSPRPAVVDLRERVRRQLVASARLAPVNPEAPISTRARVAVSTASQRRLRIITAVVGLHVAALLVFAVAQISMPTNAPLVEETPTWISAKPMPAIPEQLPRDWTELKSGGFDLVALRRTPELRAAARRRFNCEPSTGAVACGLRWLMAQQRDDGSFATEPSVTLAPDAELASQALATLALLGEGGGSSTTDQLRLHAARRAVEHLTVTNETGAVPRALVTLAKVEAVLFELAEPRTAESALLDLAQCLPAEPGAAGLGGFALLAVETAQQAGLSVPARLSDHLHSTLGRQLPPLSGPEQDLGRIGLAAFARLVLGYRENPSTTALLEVLASNQPTTTTTDGLGYFFAGLALREAGGSAWDGWIAALQSHLGSAFVDQGPGLAAVPATAVRHAPNQIFATAIAVLDLQIAYRYLPTAP